MRRGVLWLLPCLCISLSVLAQDTGTGTCDPDGVQASGAVYRICMPPSTPWNGDLVIYCHGYVEPGGPTEVPEDEFCFGDLCIYSMFNSMGYAFVASSYSTHGVAVREGVADVIDLVDVFAQYYGQPNRVFLVGFSEGAQIAVLVAEQRPDLVNGVVSACGPIGDWRMQVDYIGDFRLVFEALFPGMIPGTPDNVPQEFIDNWDTYWEETVRPAMLAPKNRWKVRQLLKIANVPAHPFKYRTTVDAAVYGLLWFNIVGTNDIIEKLGGQPYDNTQRRYVGGPLASGVNESIQRVTADPEALDTIEDFYQTSGQLDVPAVVLHTILDTEVPYWHVPLYQMKLIKTGREDMATYIPVAAYGHCNFSALEVLASFAIVVRRATGEFPKGLARLTLDSFDREELKDLLATYSNQHLIRAPQ